MEENLNSLSLFKMSKKLIDTDIKLGKGTLVLEALEDLGIDFPIDWGENTNGRWEKWNSGKLVQRGKKYGTFSSGYSIHSGGGLYRTNFTNVNYPIGFKSISNIISNIISIEGSVGYKLPMGEGTLLRSPDYALQRGVQSSDPVRYVLHWEAVGRWK